MLQSERLFWHKLSKQAVRDQDPKKLKVIADEVSRILEENETHLKNLDSERASAQRVLSIDRIAPSAGDICRCADSTKGEVMENYIRNNARPWTRMDDMRLKDLAAHYTPAREIAFRLGRTVEAVYFRASEKNVRLSPRTSRA